MDVNFIDVTGKEMIRTFYVKRDNEESRLSSNTNNVITKIFEWFLDNYQKEEQILRNGSNYVFQNVDVLNIHFHKIDLKRGSSYINSPQLIKNKHTAINSKNIKDNRCI